MMGGGGKGGGGSQTVGYKYHMGVQVVVCHGPVDSVRRIMIGERTAWSGNVTSNTTIEINQPELFGGDSREGGVVGQVDIMMGAGTQGRNPYLQAFQGNNCPGYRGLLSLVFKGSGTPTTLGGIQAVLGSLKSFMWSSGNPYFKAPWVEATRVLAGWHTPVWNAEDAYIGSLDMNPAHIIYQCLTDPAWGMGYNPSDIGEESFGYAADLMKAEGFGLSIEWSDKSDIETFVGTILDHINGALGINMATGKFELKLIRDDYDTGDLLELNESNVIELKSFQRAAFGDSINEVVVAYRDRDGNDKQISVQNLASVNAQGGVITTTKQYLGIRDDDLAAKVALRDLTTLTAPLAQVTLVCNRDAWDKEIGDVVKLVWPSLGLAGVAFRITAINKGNLTSSEIEISMVEDIFGLPDNAYTVAPPTQWIDNVVPPVPADVTLAQEATYWEVVKNINLANQNELQPGYGFGMLLAGRGAVQAPLGYVLSASSDDTEYADVSNGNFNPTGTLAAAIGHLDTSLTLSGAYDLDAVILAEDGGYLICGNEYMAVVSCNPESGLVEVERGILDTVPSSHATGTRVFFKNTNTSFDPTERVDGELVYYRPRPVTGIGTLAVDDAETEQLLLVNRATRPYPPGNVKIGGEYFPVTIAGPNIDVTWAHRDRTQQTVDFVGFTEGNIGPEAGTTYRIRVYNGSSMLYMYDIDGSQTVWSFPTDDDDASGNLAILRIVLTSVRDGLESLYAVDHTFQRLAVSGGIFYENKPATPTLFASPAAFAVDLSWDFGDSRTNLDKTELWVSPTPDFEDGATLRYEAYPSQSYKDEIGTVHAFRWYWARVMDDNGQLSDWSAPASARAQATNPQDMLDDINELLTDGSGDARIEILADRFLIRSPNSNLIPFGLVETEPDVWKAMIQADVVINGNVAIANLTEGALQNDVMMSLGGGVIELDGAGEIRVFKDLAPNADFVRLSSGEIRFLRYIGGSYVTYNFLSRIEQGVANNGTEVTIPGYWKSQPRVFVSPASIAVYNPTYANQGQTLACGFTGLQETVPGSGVWKFTPTAQLQLATASGGSAINQTSGSTSSNTWVSPTQITPANCVQITPIVSLKSVRGNGGGQYYLRTVRWRVDYWSGSAWVSGSWRNVNMGTQINAVSDSVVFNFPSGAAWQWRVVSEAFDTDGTVWGSPQYEYSSEVLSLSAASADFGIIGTDTASGPTKILNANGPAVPSSVVNPTWEIYQIDYALFATFDHQNSAFCSQNYRYDVNAVSMGGPASGWKVATYGPGLPTYYTPSASGASGCAPGVVGTAGCLPAPSNQLSIVSSVTGSSLSKPNNIVTTTTLYQTNNSIRLKVNYTAASSVTIRRRRLLGSTTPENEYTLGSYTYNLATAQVLAAGSLNWQATGE